MRAMGFNLLAAIIAFMVGTAAQSLMFTSNGPQEKAEPGTTVSAIENPILIDSPAPPFRSSNISRIVSMLNQLVESSGTAKTNTFYVEEVEDEQRGGRFAQVYWKEDRSIIFTGPPYDAENFNAELTYLKKIDLNHDVVPTEADVGTCNYLVAKPWIEAVIKHCVQNGVKITITNPIRKPRSRVNDRS